MKINPNELRALKFGRKLIGGYRQQEVNQYMETLAREWEILTEKNDELTQRLEAAELRIHRHEEMEQKLLTALKEVEQTRHLVLAQSKKEAAVRVMQAKVQAERILNHAKEHSANMLRDAHHEYKIKLADMKKKLALLENNYKVIDQHTDRMINEMTAVMNDTISQINKLARLKKLSFLDEKIKKTQELIEKDEVQKQSVPNRKSHLASRQPAEPGHAIKNQVSRQGKASASQPGITVDEISFFDQLSLS